MSTSNSEQQMLNGIRRELDRSCERLDAATLSRLNRIRHEALEYPGQRFTPWRVFAASAFSACALVLAISFYLNPGEFSASEDIALSELEAMEILSADDSLELYEEIEFYQWLSMSNEL